MAGDRKKIMDFFNTRSDPGGFLPRMPVSGPDVWGVSGWFYGYERFSYKIPFIEIRTVHRNLKMGFVGDSLESPKSTIRSSPDTDQTSSMNPTPGHTTPAVGTKPWSRPGAMEIGVGGSDSPEHVFSLRIVDGILYGQGAMAFDVGDRYENYFPLLFDGDTPCHRNYTFRLSRDRPVPGMEDTVVSQVSVGFDHALILLPDGRVMSYGSGNYGQLGLADAQCVFKPRLVPTSPGTKVVQMSTGRVMSYVEWHGQLGLADAQRVFESRLAPTSPRTKVVQVSAGRQHSLLLLEGGGVMSFGDGCDGRLGHGDVHSRRTPQLIVAFHERALQVSAGGMHSLVLMEGGGVMSFGNGWAGQLGHGDEATRSTPKLVEGLCGHRVVQVSAGYEHSLVLYTDGVASFGWGGSGQLGHGCTQWRNVPTCILALRGKKVVQASAGGKHTIFLVDDGTVWACGYGDCTPEIVPALSGRKAVQIDAGAISCAVLLEHRKGRLVAGWDSARGWRCAFPPTTDAWYRPNIPPIPTRVCRTDGGLTACEFHDATQSEDRHDTVAMWDDELGADRDELAAVCGEEFTTTCGDDLAMGGDERPILRIRPNIEPKAKPTAKPTAKPKAKPKARTKAKPKARTKAAIMNDTATGRATRATVMKRTTNKYKRAKCRPPTKTATATKRKRETRMRAAKKKKKKKAKIYKHGTIDRTA